MPQNTPKLNTYWFSAACKIADDISHTCWQGLQTETFIWLTHQPKMQRRDAKWAKSSPVYRSVLSQTSRYMRLLWWRVLILQNIRPLPSPLFVLYSVQWVTMIKVLDFKSANNNFCDVVSMGHSVIVTCWLICDYILENYVASQASYVYQIKIIDRVSWRADTKIDILLSI